MSITSKEDRRYLDHLAVQLQLHYVPGERIGEILAEAEAHAAESGESLRDAFGDPKEYARQWAVPPPRRNWLRNVGFGLWGGTTGFGLAYGVSGLAPGQDMLDWLLIVLCTLSSVGFAASAPLNRIHDPRTGRPRGWSRTTYVLLALGMCVIITGAGLAGAMLR